MHHKYLDAAIEIAIKAHSGQLDRYGEPYIFHPIRVMIKADTIENKIIAILHDVIEKSSHSAKDLRGIGFSGSVVDTVVSLSRIDKESYQDYIDRVSLNQSAIKIKLLDLDIPHEYQYLLWLAFFSSFAVKLPMWPFHTWLPDAHVEAPTAGSVLLAAILLKMAGYGFIRFSLGLFPVASEIFTPLIYTLSVIAIIFTSFIALMQDDMKKLIAYSSVAHMGFVTLGIFTIQQQGIEGSIIQMISHGLVSAALFLCVGVVYDRMHSRLINTYGGIVTIIPKYSILFMLFTLAALGLPGTTGFVGEFLILMGAFKDNFLVAVIASLGVILGAAYMLWLYKRVVFGKLINEDLKKILDLNRSEYFILSCLAAPILFFGFYPEPLINTIEVSVSDLINMHTTNLAGK